MIRVIRVNYFSTLRGREYRIDFRRTDEGPDSVRWKFVRGTDELDAYKKFLEWAKRAGLDLAE